MLSQRPGPRATARVPTPHPLRTRPYKDTELYHHRLRLVLNVLRVSF